MEANGKAIDHTRKQKELTSELAAASLDGALDSCDVESFMKLLGEVIKARLGYSAVARSAGLNRTALYKIASPEGNPALHTLVSLLTPLGLRLSVKVRLPDDAHSYCVGCAQTRRSKKKAQ
jgi:probable addiction module antidote protein